VIADLLSQPTSDFWVKKQRLTVQEMQDGMARVGVTGIDASTFVIPGNRLANVVERLYAIGVGSNDDPATLVWEGAIGFQDAGLARAS
jgi:hypothetical protein